MQQPKPPPPAAAEKRWQKTQYTNLIRYAPSGTYFARLRVGGKHIRQSLKTDVLSVAKLRLGDLEKAERCAAESRDGVSAGRMLFSGPAAIYGQRIDGEPTLKAKSKAYYHQRIAALFRSWPSLENTDVRRVNKNECLMWAAKFGQEASPTAFNNTVKVLRDILDVAIELGARYDHPAKAIARASLRAKKLHLPEATQFSALIRTVETGGGRFSVDCADLVRFLAYGGFRKGEAANITWADCDFTKGEILVRGDQETGTKNWTVRRVPMIADMMRLLEKLQRERPGEPMTNSVMRVRECQKAMDRAAKIVGMQRITHHDLRHLFATRCIESGVDIPTVSRWLGHKDGGALAMRTYGHLRDEHSANMAKKVTF